MASAPGRVQSKKQNNSLGIYYRDLTLCNCGGSFHRLCEAIVFVLGNGAQSQQDELEPSLQASDFHDVSDQQKMVFFVMGVNA